jgi:F0F1-type ATP synthase delta subunit
MKGLFSFLHTREDALYMQQTLDTVSSNLFSVKSSFEHDLLQAFSLPVAEEILKDMREQGVSSQNGALVQKYIDTLKSEIQQLPKITLRIAFNPGFDLIRNISMRFDAISETKVLLEFVVDPKVIGGVSIEWNGVFLDYSLKKLLQEKLSSQKATSNDTRMEPI